MGYHPDRPGDDQRASGRLQVMSTDVEQHSPGITGARLVALTVELLNECAALRVRDD
jgi:hypothetical protein